MLKDEDTLADRKIEGGATITVVKGVDKDNNATSSSSSSFYLCHSKQGKILAQRYVLSPLDLRHSIRVQVNLHYG